MLRGFRHTLFLLLQLGVALSGAIAMAIWPGAWQAIGVCVLGSLVASLICERIAGRYLRRTLGRLRRVADDLGRGRDTTAAMEVHPGDDFYKLVGSINAVATRLAQAGRQEQQLQEELRRRERLAFLGELAATVAHEVNNPLDGMQNCLRILRRCQDDPPRAAAMLDLIDSGLQRIELIVRRLLTLARQNVIRPEPARVSDVVSAALEAVRDKLGGRGVSATIDVQTADDRAGVDAALLEQVFVNLALNAADSMSDGGALCVAVRRDDAAGAPAAVCVDVADSGTGIDPAVLPHIFEPFFTTKDGGRGTGLGLALAQRIVDAHRGAIQVAPREGGGTVFTVRLPALSTGPALAGAPRPAETHEPHRAERHAGQV